MTRKTRTLPLPLPELIQRNRNAATVYLSLRYLAGDSRQLRTTRAKIGHVCGLHRETITKAVRVLHDGRWIKRSWGRAVNRRWYRITFVEISVLPWVGKTVLSATSKTHSPKAGKTDPSARSKERKNRPKRSLPLGRKNRRISLERERRDPAAPEVAAGRCLATGGETDAANHSAEPQISIIEALGLHE